MHSEIRRNMMMYGGATALFFLLLAAAIMGRYYYRVISSSQFAAIILGSSGVLLAFFFLSFLKYYPVELVVEHVDGDTFLTIKCKLGGFRRIHVKSFERIPAYQVLRLRTGGFALGSTYLGVFKGPYGYVLSYAISDDGLLVEGVDGLKCFVAVPSIDEVIDALLDEGCKRRVIKVKKSS